jgi:hypothetical protein
LSAVERRTVKSGWRLLKRRWGEAGEGGSARACHTAEGEGEKGEGTGSIARPRGQEAGW